MNNAVCNGTDDFSTMVTCPRGTSVWFDLTRYNVDADNPAGEGIVPYDHDNPQHRRALTIDMQCGCPYSYWGGNLQETEWSRMTPRTNWEHEYDDSKNWLPRMGVVFCKRGNQKRFHMYLLPLSPNVSLFFPPTLNCS